MLKRWILQPSERLREVYLGIGSFLLILSIIAFAGADFSFDEELKPRLRLLAMVLLGIGGVLWLRGSIAPRSS